jgi:hypothetical protein
MKLFKTKFGLRILKKLQDFKSQILIDYRLTMSLQALKRDDSLRSRLYLDKVLGVYDQSYDFYSFVIAFDAMVLNAEDRHDESLKRLRECQDRLGGKSDPDNQYVRLFCQFYECLYVGGGNCKKYMDESLLLEANSTIRRFLKFPRTWPIVDRA